MNSATCSLKEQSSSCEQVALWSEVDFEKETITIPASKMKMKQEHSFYITSQIKEILESILPYSKSKSIYVFPSPISNAKPLSENTINVSIKRLGFNDYLVSHGFRHIFSTFMYKNQREHGFSSEIIERALSHSEANKIKNAYNKATYKEELKALMIYWNDFLDGVKNGK